MEDTQNTMLSHKTIIADECPTPAEKPTQRSNRFSPSKYKLWPRAPKRHETVHPATFGTFLITAEDKKEALSVARSPTSLSDNVIPTALNNIASAYAPRSSSLASRRKISVPELKSKASWSPQESQSCDMDSPTIPGRPPLRKMISMDVIHSRSSSAPNHTRVTAPVDAELQRIFASPSSRQASAVSNTNSSTLLLPATTYNPTRPLSPIMSPVESTAPKLTLPSVSTTSLNVVNAPPKVPPKTPRTLPQTVTSRGSPIRLVRKSSKPTLNHIQLPSVNIITPPTSNTASPRSEPRMSPIERVDSVVGNRNSVISVMERGRPVKKKLLNHADTDLVDGFEMPTGYKPMEATLIFSEGERESLRRQAQVQTEKFEVLDAGDIADLSQELRALDERCDYLRRTYKSLRAGRQKLHLRMATYLKSDSISFSRERLLKQEEALIELDLSIDVWFEKLEQAESRRVSVRQKLLEHVAAAMALNTAYPPPPTRAAPTTPPMDPTPILPVSESIHTNRTDVQSIKVYADNGVLDLFSDIERAVSSMCEAC